MAVQPATGKLYVLSLFYLMYVLFPPRLRLSGSRHFQRRV